MKIATASLAMTTLLVIIIIGSTVVDAAAAAAAFAPPTEFGRAFTTRLKESVEDIKLVAETSSNSITASIAPPPSKEKKVSSRSSSTRRRTGLGGMAELKLIAEKSNPALKFYDPLGFANVDIYDQGTDASIAFLRHAEIKHGRIAMFAFVGYVVHANGIKWPWPMTLEGEPFPASNSPPEIWDALPDGAKYQIIAFIGFLEMFSEIGGPHYMREGGQPGRFPNFSDHPELIPHPALNLYDPYNMTKKMTPEQKETGLISELNHGRLAQIGILGFLAEQKVPGSVPMLSVIGNFPHYDGEPMAPF